MSNPGHTFTPTPAHCQGTTWPWQSPATARVPPAPWCPQPCAVPSPVLSPALLSPACLSDLPRDIQQLPLGCSQCQGPAEVVLGTGSPGSRSSLCREMCVFMCVCVCICMPKTPNWFVYIFMHLKIASCANDGCSTSTTSVLSQTCYFPSGCSICSVRVLKCYFSHTVSGRKLQCSLYILSIT